MSKTLDLVFNPDPRLRERSKEIEINEISSLLGLCADMEETMRANDGVGLAAPQIGKNIRLILVLTNDGAKPMFNPIIQKQSLLSEWGEEGCLSIPKTFGDVKRHKKTICNYLDEKGQTRTIEAKGLLARIIQHEIDHLDGVLFIDKAKNIHTV